MTDDRAVSIITEGLRTSTSDLHLAGHRELSVLVSGPGLLEEGRKLIEHIVQYIRSGGVTIFPGETLRYGYWMIKFRERSSGALDIWEYNAHATEFVQGATLTLTYWRDQHSACERLGAPFVPPTGDQLAVISAGVLEGDHLEAVRYPSPGHMSGWWITTDRYDGNPQSLVTEHLYHVTGARPEVAPYIALPFGFRLHFKDERNIWYDEEVANGPAV